MKKIIFALILCMICSVASAQSVGQLMNGITSSGVVTHLKCNSDGYLLQSGILTQGSVKHTVLTIATGTVVNVGSYASSINPPMWITLQNTGSSKVIFCNSTGSNATDSENYLNSGDILVKQYATNTISIYVTATSSVASLFVGIEK